MMCVGCPFQVAAKREGDLDQSGETRLNYRECFGYPGGALPRPGTHQIGG